MKTIPIQFNVVGNDRQNYYPVLQLEFPDDCEDVIDYLDRFDKRDMMAKNDWCYIMNYEVFAGIGTGGTTDMLREAFANLDEQLLIDFDVIYERMSESIANLSERQRISIVLDAMSVAYQAAGNAYKHVATVSSSRH